MMINRRTLMRGMMAVAAAPTVPAFLASASASVAAPVAAPAQATPLLSYCVGTGDDWNWLPIKARSPSEALAIWRGEQGFGSICEAIEAGETPEPCEDCAFCFYHDAEVRREAAWDGHDVKPGDRRWMSAGFGAICSRCKGETFEEEGARFDAAGKLVCNYCETPAEREARLGSEDA